MANWRRVPFAASCAVVVAVVGADASCLLAVLAFANLLLAKTRTRPLLGRPRLTPAAATPAGRQAHWPQRGLAGPYSLWARLAVVWLCIHSTAPAPRCCRCGGRTGRGTLCLRLSAAWPCPPPSPTPAARTCERACCCCLPWSTDHRPAATNPPRCLQRIYARRAARHHRQLGGRVGKLTVWLDASDRERWASGRSRWSGSCALGRAGDVSCSLLVALSPSP